MSMKKKLLWIGVVVVLVVVGVALTLVFAARPGVRPVSPVTGIPQGTDRYPWWNDTVFYEIFVRSFYDSDGDGTGDFNGITAKLDYLNDGDPETTTDLGVTGLWLMPIHPSPSYHGYDVTDYMAVNPDYGTMDDFKNMLAEAHARGIRVVMDLVLNHTSREHPWFEASRDPASPYRNYYIWADEKPNYNGPWGQKVWIAHSTGYYYALFWEGMPDLNYANPAVTAEMDAIVSFWLTEVGVDGFRLDAAKHLIEEGAAQANTESTHAWYQQFRTFYKSINPDAMTVGEVAGENPLVLSDYTGDELDLTFEFGVAEAFVASALEGNAGMASGQLKLTYKLIPELQYATFLTNHDQNRVMTQLNADPEKARVAASLLLTAPGVPFIYYGEEIGMQGQKPDEGIRCPMQWSGEKYAGFSTDFPWESLGPDWETCNAAAETNDPNSLLSHYRTLIHIRSQHAALRVGDPYIVRADNAALYALLRVSDEETVLVIINLSDAPVSGYTLSLEESGAAPGAYRVPAILGAAEPLAGLTIDENGGFTDYVPLPEIPTYDTVIVQLQFK